LYIGREQNIAGVQAGFLMSDMLRPLHSSGLVELTVFVQMSHRFFMLDGTRL
jgi:hypothetical protein